MFFIKFVLLIKLNIDLENSDNSMIDTHYDLIANICHEGKPGKGNGIYKVHVQHRGKDQWYQIQDLIVEEINAQMIFLSESYIQVIPLINFIQLYYSYGNSNLIISHLLPDMGKKRTRLVLKIISKDVYF